MINFRKFFDQQLQSAWRANIEAVRKECATKVSTATRKKIATLAIKTGSNYNKILADVATNDYAAASIAVDPKKQVWQKEQVNLYLKSHGLPPAPNDAIILVLSDDGGSQRKQRADIQTQIDNLTKPTVVIIEDVINWDYTLNDNVIFLGSSDEWIERNGL